MTRPAVTVVTVTYNAAKTIARTIDSVLAQTYDNVEYLVIDGGSTDETLDILKSYGTRVSWLSEPDRGIYDAMNKGIGRAKGEWIHLLNGDDWYVAPDVLEKAVPHLDPTRTTYFDMIRVGADGSTVLQNRNVRPWMLFVSAFLPHPALIVARSQYDAVGLYDLRYKIAADHDVILRLVRKFPPKHVPFVLTNMDQTGMSARLLSTSLEEFTVVTKRNGLPGPLADGLRNLKRIWWGIGTNV